MLIYPIGTTQSCRQACALLAAQGFPFTDHPCPEITHLLLDIPAFQPDGNLRGGVDLAPVLSMIPPAVCVIGGNLDHPCLSWYRKWDLLKDPVYLANNAQITADCALRLAAGKLEHTFSDTPVLVIGWGRIGKCLAQMLRSAGCPVSVAARKDTDRAMIQALGYAPVSIAELAQGLNQYHLIFNTVPARLPDIALPEGVLAYELASTPGLPEDGAICARGLPGIMAPYSSGRLISQTIVRFIQEEIP